MIIESLPNSNYGNVFTQRRDGRISLRFQTLTVSVTVSHFSCPYRVNATPKRKNFVPFSNSAPGVGCSKPVKLKR